MTTLTVGSGQNYATLSAAVAAAKPGDTIDVQAGTYTNDFPGLVNGLTIEGVGGLAKFVATVQPGNGKAILDVAGSTTLRNLDLSGVSVPDANGAAIRYESGNLVIQNSVIHGNQDGILGASDATGTITIDGSEFYGNGTSSGSTHNIYIGDVAAFTLTDSYIHDASTGHEVKSRAENNVITNNRIEDNSSTASYEIDLPNGGNATISGNTVQKSANSGNHVTIAYGEEGSLHGGTIVTVTNNVFASDQSGADVLWNAPGVAIGASGNTIYNYAAIDKAGHVGSGGFATLGARPSLDTSSPIKANGNNPTVPSTTPANNTPANNTPATTNPAKADTTPPTLTVSQSISGTTTSTGNTLSGTATDSSGIAAVEIFVNSAGRSTDIGAATLNGSSWSYNVNNLTPGTYTFYAVGFDRAGNATAPIQTGPAETVTAAQSARDTTPPTLTVSQSISGTTTSTGNTLSGTATDSSGIAAVEIFVNSAGRSTDIGAATLNGSSWSYNVNNLTPGTYTFYAVGFDRAGNATAPIQTGPAETVVASPSPAIAGVTRSGGTLTVSGTGTAGKTVTVLDTAAGQNRVVGSTTAANDGSWTISTATLASGTVHALFAQASGTTSGALVLASTASDMLAGTTGQADVFAFARVSGNDVINGFETAAAGSTHDVIDLAGTGYGSFDQLKPLMSGGPSAVIRFDGSTSITLTGVNANTLSAADFRFT